MKKEQSNLPKQGRWKPGIMSWELRKLLGFGNADAIEMNFTGDYPEDAFRCDAEGGAFGPHQVFRKPKKLQ